MRNIVKDYFSLLAERLQVVIDTQENAIQSAAEICAQSIAKEKLVFTFGTGHGEEGSITPHYQILSLNN